MKFTGEDRRSSPPAPGSDAAAGDERAGVIVGTHWQRTEPVARAGRVGEAANHHVGELHTLGFDPAVAASRASMRGST